MITLHGSDIEVLEYNDNGSAEMELAYGTKEDVSEKYKLSEETGRKQLYDDLFENFDNEDETKQKSEKFEKLNNNLYYAYGETYNEIFRINQRLYIVGNSNNSTLYLFAVNNEGKFTKAQEESILKVLSTVK